MREPRLFPAEIEVIRAMLERGASYHAVARKLDRDVQTVRRNALRIGVKSRHRGRYAA